MVVLQGLGVRSCKGMWVKKTKWIRAWTMQLNLGSYRKLKELGFRASSWSLMKRAGARR